MGKFQVSMPDLKYMIYKRKIEKNWCFSFCKDKGLAMIHPIIGENLSVSKKNSQH